MQRCLKANILLQEIIDKLDINLYFANLEGLERSFRLPSPHIRLDDIDFQLLKMRVSEFHPFTVWGNIATKKGMNTDIIRRILSVYIAGLGVSITQEQEASSAFIGKSSRTYDFRTDIGNLTDSVNEWLRLGYKLTGSKAGSNIAVRALR